MAADCKSAISGSNPGGASPVHVLFLTAKERLTRVIPWTWDHPRFLLRIAAARTPSQAKAGFCVLRVYRFRNHSPALPSESLVRIPRVERRGWGGDNQIRSPGVSANWFSNNGSRPHFRPKTIPNSLIPRWSARPIRNEDDSTCDVSQFSVLLPVACWSSVALGV